MITKGDKILIFFILIIAFSIMTGFKYYGFNDNRTYAIIEQNNKVVEKVSLDKDRKLVIKLPTAKGDNIVEIDGERVRMKTAYCKDQDCVKQGFIDKKGQVIVCLPNRILIKIVGNTSNKKDVDAISY